MRLTRLALILSLSLLGGCEMMGAASAPRDMGESGLQLTANASTGVPGARGVVSLFPGDQAVVSDAEITRIFATKIEMPAESKLAVLCIGPQPWLYWSAESADLNQQATDTFLTKLKTANHIKSATMVPDMLRPPQITIPNLRKTAAQTQADLILICQSQCSDYQKSRFLHRDETRAYCTMEAALIDTRSGIIIFTTRATQDFAARQTDRDMNSYEMQVRTQQEAARGAMDKIADRVVEFAGTQQ